ncbi:YqeG family HAD IIIA-type phosphatase [Bacillus suaedae]|uniref:YqeG family HAD IIIA-type phosphatase n=1 Tax=Halalkalibacter suaedae TaxID=2822140 RepID=A0A941AN78_9BACI|nr:YqeG family HAD IIIA-type phosphatase [Bacillus suaedae]MBP3951340.1 YqeG family HAD IIIA-type phosphatase [Bacillus suaedae]
MFKKLLPSQYEKSIYDIKLQELKQRGIKGVITDLDNTLVEWDRESATPEVQKWFKQLNELGMKVTIVSNNNLKRVQKFADPEKVLFIHSAQKPRTRAFKLACVDMGLKHDEVVVIGDQIFTDVFGGNRAGIHTILVVPVAKTDGLATKLNRKMEQVVLRSLKKRGMIHWED